MGVSAKWGLKPQEEVRRGLEGGGRNGGGRVVELFRLMQGRRTGYLHLKGVKEGDSLWPY